MHYKKTANILGIFATSRLVTNFWCGQNVRRIERGDCTNISKTLLNYFYTYEG